MTDLRDYREKLDADIQDRDYWNKQVSELEDKLQESDASLIVKRAALDNLVHCAMQVQESIQVKVAKLVSDCLEYVFEEPYEFRIVFEEKRNTTEARLVFMRDGEEIEPMSASGGGVIDVAAFGLRLACLMLTTPTVRPLMVMDEPFRFLSVQYRDRVRSLIEQLAEEYDCQFIIVTHMDELRIGTVVDLGKG